MNPRRAAELRLAFLLLTRLPAGRIAGEAPAFAASAWAWPLAGAAVGLIAGLAGLAALGLGLPPVMAALVVLAAAALATGAMHEDGLADVADGFGGGRGRAAKLAIMRDSRIGAYGVLALGLAVAFRGAGIATAAEARGLVLPLIGVFAASRAAMAAAAALMPAARADGLGRAAAAVDPAALRAALAIGLLCLLPIGLGAALAVAFAIAVAALVTGALAMRQIGGQTGDVLGAVQQIGECAGWAALAALHA